MLFASIVDDPSSRSDEFPTEEDQERERQRLFRLIEQLVRWEATADPVVIAAARKEIENATGGNPPAVLDPFCGGGSIALEAQRLGLDVQASDLNPVPVLITKALVEIPSKFSGQPPVHPDVRQIPVGGWTGARGLAEDVRRYGAWMREEAFRRIGHLYPKAKLPDGREAPVIAWLWARMVVCPNPACGAHMPLVTSWKLATKKGKERFVRPVVDTAARTVRFEVADSEPEVEVPKLGRGAKFRCLVCDQVAPEEHVKAEGADGHMAQQLMAVVAEGDRSRIYVTPTSDDEAVADGVGAAEAPTEPLPHDPRNVWCAQYGLTGYGDLFTPRQLVALDTLTGLVGEARQRVVVDGGDQPYGDAVATYLGFVVSRIADSSSTLVTWASNPDKEMIRSTFARQALPMTWDFAEANVFGPSSGSLEMLIEWIAKVIERVPAAGAAEVSQLDAKQAARASSASIVCTDPPYYDNISYADLSDFFYIWLRRSLRAIYSDLLSTLLTPKQEELVATPYRFNGSRKAAEEFFERAARRVPVRVRRRGLRAQARGLLPDPPGAV